MNLKEILTVTMILFAVIDVIGSVPVVVALKNKVGKIDAGKATLVSMAIMIGFLFLGESILKLIGLDISSFAIAGSLVLFFLALEMILGIRLYRDDAPDTASIVPLAFPIIAGTGTMTTLISLKSQFSTENIIIGICVNLVLVYIVLKNTGKIENLLGKGGLGVLRKVFGVILLALAVKLFKTNLGI